MLPKDFNSNANNVDPDQTAPVCLDLSAKKMHFYHKKMDELLFWNHFNSAFVMVSQCKGDNVSYVQ